MNKRHIFAKLWNKTATKIHCKLSHTFAFVFGGVLYSPQTQWSSDETFYMRFVQNSIYALSQNIVRIETFARYF